MLSLNFQTSSYYGGDLSEMSALFRSVFGLVWFGFLLELLVCMQPPRFSFPKVELLNPKTEFTTELASTNLFNFFYDQMQ